MIVLHGAILTPIDGYEWKYYPDGICAFEQSGEILFVGHREDFRRKYGDREPQQSGLLILPGMIDLHTHLPQFGLQGLGDLSLLDWLEKWVFPEEERYEDLAYTEQQAEKFFNNLIKSGTTTAVVFGPAYSESVNRAFEVASDLGLRVFMGMTLMDRNVPQSLRQDVREIERDTVQLIQKWHKPKGLTSYVITPRFAISCSPALLHLCSQMAQQWDCYIQTHLAENEDEIREVLRLFPHHSTYTSVYADYRLLTNRTILAHCIYLDQSELHLIKNAGAAIAHCPCSNRFLLSGLMPLVAYMKYGVKIGLGTDIAAGYNFSILREAAEARENSKIYAKFLQNFSTRRFLSSKEALWLATRGAAEALGLYPKIGVLHAGSKADIVCCKPQMPLSDRLPEEIISFLLYQGSFLPIIAVYGNGRLLYANNVQ